MQKTSKLFRKIVIVFMIVLFVPIILLLLVGVGLYLPPVQKFAKNKIEQVAVDFLGADVSIGSLYLKFPLNLTISDLLALQAPQDTLVYVEQFKTQLPLAPSLFFAKEFPIDFIGVKNMNFHYVSEKDSIDIKGAIGDFSANDLHVSLNAKVVHLGVWTLKEGKANLKMKEIEQQDTTSRASLDWSFDLNRLLIEDLSFAYELRGKEDINTINVATTLPHVDLKDLAIDLSSYTATLQSIFTKRGTLTFVRPQQEPVEEGFDVNNILLSDLNLDVRSLAYTPLGIDLSLKKANFKEHCGFDMTSLSGKIHYDSVAVVLNDFKARTPWSRINVDVHYPFALLDQANEDLLSIVGDAFLSRNDLSFVLPKELSVKLKDIPENKLLHFSFDARGSERSLAIKKAKVSIDKMFSLNFQGKAQKISDVIRRSGQLTYNFFLARQGAEIFPNLISEFNPNIRLPESMTFKGETSLAHRRITSKNRLKDGNSEVMLNGSYSLHTEEYEAELKIDSLVPAHFIKKDSLLLIDGSFHLKGQYTDPYNPKAFFRLGGMLDQVQWGQTQLREIQTDISLQDQIVAFVFNSNTEGANLSLILDGILSKDGINAGVRAEINDLDVMKLNLSENQFKTRLILGGELRSDLKEQHNFIGTVEDFVIRLEDQVIRPKDLTILANTSSDSIQMKIKSGDLDILFRGDEGLNKSMEQLSLFMDRTQELLKDTTNTNRTAELVPLYPNTSLKIKAGTRNLISTYLKHNGVVFRDLDLNISTDTIQGLGGNINLHTLMIDTMRIDLLNLKLRQDSLGFQMLGNVRKYLYRKQIPFVGDWRIGTDLNHLDFDMNIFDLNRTPTWKLAVYGKRKPEGYSLNILNGELMIAQNKFSVNKDNYVLFDKDQTFDANLHLQHQNGSEIYLLSDQYGDQRSLQLLVDRVQLSDFKGLFGLDGIEGLFVADIRYLTQQKENSKQIKLQSELAIFDFHYNGDRIGDIGLFANYKPVKKGMHQGDFVLSHDGYELGFAKGEYTDNGREEQVEGTFSVKDLPLKIFNPFVPEKMAKFKGTFFSDLSIKGTAEAPIIDGQIVLKDANAEIPSIGTTIRFEEKPFTFSKGILKFDQYGIRTTQENPFIIDGTIDLRNLNQMRSNLKLSAKDMQLINARRTRESLAYGRLYVDLNMSLRGPFDALRIRGNASILGNTDFTYVMSDSRLVVQDRMKDLVTFSDFNDTLYVKKKKEEFSLGDMNVLLGIHIDQSAILRADLTPDRESRVEVEGGGDLSFSYRPSGAMTLSGKYELIGGKISYSMPIIPLKQFKIKPGSFIQWTGDLMNPTLNLHAVERVRSSVSLDGGQSRQVNFDITASVLQSLEDFELKFDLEAPEDLSTQNLLASLTSEERSRQALNLMTTGVFMGEASNVNVSSALSSFIQKEFNNLTGTAFEDADFTIGMENYDNSLYGGGNYTDYKFRFSKRFYDDRLKVILGGRVTSGDAPPQRTQSFVDNITLEFRLNRTGGRLLQLFHKRNYQSVLEGEILETGAGIILRRKIGSLHYLWPFYKPKKEKLEKVEEEEQ